MIVAPQRPDAPKAKLEGWKPRSKNDRQKLGHAARCEKHILHTEIGRLTRLEGYDSEGEKIWEVKGAYAHTTTENMHRLGIPILTLHSYTRKARRSR